MILDRLKLVGAALVLVSLVLPLASCSHFEDSQGRRVKVAEGEAPPEGVRKVVERTWALEDFDVADPSSWLVLAAFVWPALAVALLARRATGKLALAVRILEPALAVGSFLLIDLLATLLVERREVGFYVAVAGLVVYLAGAIREDGLLLGAWRRRRRQGRSAESVA